MASTPASRGPAPSELRNLRVPAKQIRRLRKELVALGLEQRLALPGMDPRRADLNVAGAVLLDCLLKRLGADELTLCDLALREGIVLDYISRNTRHIAQTDGIPDVRRRSTIELAERCNYAADHAQQVQKLALVLFDRTRPVHGLTDREREWLEHGALMHDIGVHISYQRHHRHSQYLIMNGDLRGFSPDEIAVMALIARYHRRGTPRKAHEEYAQLPPALRRAVRALASILRVAESLDRSHAQLVTGLELVDTPEELLVRVSASGDAELEVWAANRHIEPFAELVGKPVRVASMAASETAAPVEAGSPARR